MLMRIYRNWNPCAQLWKCKMVPLWKIVWRLLQKLKVELLYHPTISLLNTYPKELKEGAQRDIYTFMFIAALFTVAKDGSKPNIY